MAQFLIEIPHAPEECFVAVSAALRDAGARGLMASTYWGCATGVHTTWIVHELEDAGSARKLVPALLEDTARVVEVTRLSLDEVHERLAEEGSAT